MPFLRMRNAISHLLPKIYEHPFNRELYQGTLPKETFRFYLEQDALYLRGFSKALMLTSSRLTATRHAEQFKLFSEEALDTERNLHTKYLGNTRSSGLFYIRKTPIKAISDYTQHLLNTAKNFPIEEAVASLIPCFWIYSDLGKKMSTYKIETNPYRSWILSYSNIQFTKAAEAIIQIADELGDTPIKQNKMISAFIKSTEYEILFWDNAYKAMEQSNARYQYKVG